MSKINDILIQLIRERCEKGYLTQEDWDLLNPVAKGFNIGRSDMEKAVEEELKPIRQRKTDEMFASLKQPEAAIAERVAFSAQSKRAFPDILYMGEATLELNSKMKAPAFVPIKGTCGFCVVHNGKADAANNMLQNVLLRLMLSLPREWAKATLLVDPLTNLNHFEKVAKIDERLCDFKLDPKAGLSFLQACSSDIPLFNLELSRKGFSDLEEFNRNNRGSVRPFQLIVIPDFTKTLDDSARLELTKIAKMGACRTGVFFLLSMEADSYEEAKPWLKVFQTKETNLCVMDITGTKAKVISHEPVDFFNNAFGFKVQTELAFDADAIAEYNHEFDSERYETVKETPTVINKGEEAIEALMLTLGLWSLKASHTKLP